jgi:hypothetical protein
MYKETMLRKKIKLTRTISNISKKYSMSRKKLINGNVFYRGGFYEITPQAPKTL